MEHDRIIPVIYSLCRRSQSADTKDRTLENSSAPLSVIQTPPVYESYEHTLYIRYISFTCKQQFVSALILQLSLVWQYSLRRIVPQNNKYRNNYC